MPWKHAEPENLRDGDDVSQRQRGQRQRLHHGQRLRHHQHVPAVRADRPRRRRTAPAETWESGRRIRRCPAAVPNRSAGRPATPWRSASSRCRSARCSGRRRTAGNCGAAGAPRQRNAGALRRYLPPLHSFSFAIGSSIVGGAPGIAVVQCR